MRLVLRHLVIPTLGWLALQGRPALATADSELVASCHNVLAATEPARRVWLERDLFAYEMHAAVGASSAELRIYRENLTDTCGRVAQNNNLRVVRHTARVHVGRRPAF